MSLFEVEMQTAMGDDTKYSRAIKSPQYVPSREKPFVAELVDHVKYSRLLLDIKNSDGITEEEREFLRLAASRHIVFNYSKIADYYAHASKEMQELMEKSALVILDIDDAIANGYMKLSENIKQLLKESGELASKE